MFCFFCRHSGNYYCTSVKKSLRTENGPMKVMYIVHCTIHCTYTCTCAMYMYMNIHVHVHVHVQCTAQNYLVPWKLRIITAWRAIFLQCSPHTCKSNPLTTNFRLFCRILISLPLYCTKKFVGKNCLVFFKY